MMLKLLYILKIVKNWVAENIFKSKSWAGLFATMIWFIWKVRNTKAFEDRDTLTGAAVAAVKIAHEFGVAKGAKDAATSLLLQNRQEKSHSPAGWSKPQGNWLKMNVDGACRGNPGPRGGGGILRDKDGNFIKAFCFKMGWGSALQAEIEACYNGLRIAKDMGVLILVLETDSAEAIRLLLDPTISTHKHFHLLQACWDLIQNDNWKTKIIHTKRINNKVADRLANHSFSLDNDFNMFNSLPHCINDLYVLELNNAL